MGWLIGRVLFAMQPHDHTVGDHPSRAAVADSLGRSTRELGRAALERSRTAPPERNGFLILLQAGFT